MRYPQCQQGCLEETQTVVSGPSGNYLSGAEWVRGWPRPSGCGCVGVLEEAGWEAQWSGWEDQSARWAQDQRRWCWAEATEPWEEMEVHVMVVQSQWRSGELLCLSCPRCYLL